MALSQYRYLHVLLQYRRNRSRHVARSIVCFKRRLWLDNLFYYPREKLQKSSAFFIASRRRAARYVNTPCIYYEPNFSSRIASRRIASRRFVHSGNAALVVLPVVVHDSVKSVSHGQHCASFKSCAYCVLDQFIRLHVHRGCGLVQNQDFGFSE